MISRLARPLTVAVSACVLSALAPATVTAQQPRVTSPQQEFGHVIGADYVLPNYTQFAKYWEKLAKESDRMTLDTIGLTAEGRPQLMAIITSPANRSKIARYREIAEKLRGTRCTAADRDCLPVGE